MTQQERVSAALVRLATAINALDTKSQNAIAAAIAGLPQAVTIDDSVTVLNKAWSSSKTQAQITAAVAALIGGAPANRDTLQELSDAVTALIQADNGLVSAAGAQGFSAAQQLQACQNIGIGDPDTNFVPAIEAALHPGL